MTYQVKAVYRGGAFVPHEKCGLPESAEVDLLVGGPLTFHRTPRVRGSGGSCSSGSPFA